MGAMEIARTQSRAKAFPEEEGLYLVGEKVTASSPFQAPPPWHRASEVLRQREKKMMPYWWPGPKCWFPELRLHLTLDSIAKLLGVVGEEIKAPRACGSFLFIPH